MLLPVERVWRPLSPLVALGGVLFALGAIIGLAISESGTLFGFHEHGYRLAVVLAIVFEGAAVVLLVADLAARPRRQVEPAAPPRVFARATGYRGDTS